MLREPEQPSIWISLIYVYPGHWHGIRSDILSSDFHEPDNFPLHALREIYPSTPGTLMKDLNAGEDSEKMCSGPTLDK